MNSSYKYIDSEIYKKTNNNLDFYNNHKKMDHIIIYAAKRIGEAMEKNPGNYGFSVLGIWSGIADVINENDEYPKEQKSFLFLRSKFYASYLADSHSSDSQMQKKIQELDTVFKVYENPRIPDIVKLLIKQQEDSVIGKEMSSRERG